MRLTPRLAQKRAAAVRAAAEKAAKDKAAAEKVAAEVARLEAQRRKLAVAPAPTPASAPQAAPRAAPELPSVKLQSPGGAAPAPVLAVAQQGAATAPAAPPERSSVGVRVQFVQGRSPLQLTLPLPLPTVGELKRRVQEASGGGARVRVARAGSRADEGMDAFCALWPRTDLLPERQRLVFAGQVLAPDDKDLSLFKARALTAVWPLARALSFCCVRRTLERPHASSVRRLQRRRARETSKRE